jgi:hypothetical protein
MTEALILKSDVRVMGQGANAFFDLVLPLEIGDLL